MLAACRLELDDLDRIFYNGDGRKVHCGASIDDAANVTAARVDAALDRAAARGEVAELYGHHPGVSIPVERIEHVLAAARDRGLRFYTYADFAAAVPVTAGLALSFDDDFAAEWFALRPLFQRYGARVTFFVTRYLGVGDLGGHPLLRQLHDDGHDIAAHGFEHLRAPSYVEEHGLGAYLANELVPSLDVLAADGYSVTSFAYPFGARTSELDDAILEHVSIVRTSEYSNGILTPCP